MDENNALVKEAVAQMLRGEAKRREVANLEEFGRHIENLASNQALTFGVTHERQVAIVTKDEQPKHPGTIARSREFFEFQRRPAIMMYDNDALGDRTHSPDDLREQTIVACPPFADAPLFWRASSSSGIFSAQGEQLTGLCGQRFYMPVIDGTAIPDAGRAIEARLWAGGLGYVKSSAAGTALYRTIFDTSVWQPERLDFTAQPILRSGLRRTTPPAKIIGDPSIRFDLRRIIADSEVYRAAYLAKQAAREHAQPVLDARREEWLSKRSPHLAARRHISVDAAREILRVAATELRLTSDFTVISADGSEVSVGELLDAPQTWHGKRFRDPLEPEYPDQRISWANLKGGGAPYLYSHAHGGRKYYLVRSSARIRMGKGLRIETTDATLDVLRSSGEIYDFGDGSCMARVVDNRVTLVTPDWLCDFMGRRANFFTSRVLHDGSVKEEACDASPAVARAIIAKSGERKLRKLNAVITAPTLLPDGSVLDEPGFDIQSGLMYVCPTEHAPRVPRNPSVDDAIAAVHTLWEPVANFPLEDAVSRAVLLHGLLTACLRASLPTAPGIGLDAPSAASGKTLLARVLGILCSGEEPAILPPADSDEEMRKRLFAAALDGRQVIVCDNVREPLNYPALDAFLTAHTLFDRKLGVSETIAVPNRALFVTTGNNLRLSGDTYRRVLVARIDAKTERPHARMFDFCPAQRVASRRVEYVVAALTIVRAYIAAGRPHVAPGRTASFEAWDALVRQPICWISEKLRADMEMFADPLAAADRALQLDPDIQKLQSLTCAWHEEFGSLPVTVAKLIERAGTGQRQALMDVIEEIAGQGSTINRRILGRWIERHAGQRRADRWIARGKLSRGSQTWSVECVLQTPSESRVDGASAEAPGRNMVGEVGYGGSISLDSLKRTDGIDSSEHTEIEV